ncbi:kinase/pyrophosphorylase [Reichenbachiella carrageenanivorans]|uniref:Kinase/pyrophosphorylase n=1 Tax=Reichenbachiella carrageenanivorans TaxID=2979869 RepID=A0ABY6D0Z9_9BACT|nr:pyruvate, water dikinase regulatory protein [Reichenbachiella carrageenanivorans]UXX79837.1 kinase/pyrophosphorylase [Reichenbachiella carrageenanivorans]
MQTTRLNIFITPGSMSFLALESFARSAAWQFPDCECEVIKVPNVKSPKEAVEVVEQAKLNEPAVVVFCTPLEEVRDAFVMAGLRLRIQCLNALSPYVEAFGQALSASPVYQPTHSMELDQNYFRKIHAIEFAINNDDGKSQSSLEKADIVLIGVSRTSKTPLSIYLAYLNFLVVNIPLVSMSSIPKHLFQVPIKKIIGLTIDPSRLNQVRAERNNTMGVASDTQYSDLNNIIHELELADKVMKKIGCPVIDVTNKAVEETAEIILKHIKHTNSK